MNIEVHNDWACFTSASNTSIRKKAETVIRKVEKSPINAPTAIKAFYRGWFKMCDNPRHIDAGVSDTAVRECVRDFGDRVLQECGFYCDEEKFYTEADNEYWKSKRNP
jgi:hypothetical protein